MATAHNAFIGALAMSDLMLCTVTLPINLWKMFNERWIFGEQSQILCGFTMAAQKFPIFLSSMSIVVIGWDRYRGVITPERLVVNLVLGSLSITSILAKVSSHFNPCSILETVHALRKKTFKEVGNLPF